MIQSTSRRELASSTVTECPECGETERLRGRRTETVIDLVCEACGHSWQRDPQRRCRSCGSDDLRYTPKPLWEKGRGEQRTPAGRIDAYACWGCGGVDVTSDDARPGDERKPYRVDPV